MIKLTTERQFVYICRDPERALGLTPEKSYCIITNDSIEGKRLAFSNKFLKLISGGKILSTLELLQHPETSHFLEQMAEPAIIVFKNTKLIENFCKEKNWKLLNPSAELASKVEEKISQVEWLGDLQKYLPPHSIVLCKDLSYKKPFIAQFNRAHTGEGTMLIASEDEVNRLKNKFPERPLRITDYIRGASYTSNTVVSENDVLCGPISYQITGITPFTNNQFATVGNDWKFAAKLSTEQKNQIHEIAIQIGNSLKKNGWRGLFGIDCIVEEKTGKVYLIEINARQPASTSYESTLQTSHGLSTFVAHLRSLAGDTIQKESIADVADGAQIIFRVPPDGIVKDLENKVEKLRNLGLNVFEYDERIAGKDLLRIQSKTGIMDDHNVLNELGEKIRKIFK